MTFDKDSLIRLMYTIIISIIISMGSAAIFFSENFTFSLMIKSIAVGIGIWLAAEIVSDIVSKRWPYSIVAYYIVLMSLIALGSCGGAYLIGVRSWKMILMICICGEAAGVAISVIYRAYYKKKLNRQLREYKSKDSY